MGRNRSDANARDSRMCSGCGRVITWRRAWANTWPEVRWCSDSCRRRGLQPLDRALEEMLLCLLGQAANGASVLPDDAIARVRAARPDVASANGALEAHDLDERARRAARRLVAQGKAEILQHGRVVDPSTARGQISLRKPHVGR